MTISKIKSECTGKFIHIMNDNENADVCDIWIPVRDIHYVRVVPSDTVFSATIELFNGEQYITDVTETIEQARGITACISRVLTIQG